MTESVTLAERIHRACPCAQKPGLQRRSCNKPPCSCWHGVVRSGILLAYEPEDCQWEGHAIAGEVEQEREKARQVLEATPSMFALEELSRWPKAAEGHPFVMLLDGKVWQVQPDQVKGIFRALREHVKEIAPSAWKAMQAYYDIDGVRQKVAALTAKVEEGHVHVCMCHDDPHGDFCGCAQDAPHPHIDPRCVEWRRK